MAVAGCLVTTAQAALIAYDGMDYGSTLADDALINLAPNGGSGFTTGFTSANVNWASSGLSGAGFGLISPEVGGAMRFDPSDTLTQRAWGNMAAAPANGTYWYSFLFRPTDSATTGNGGRGTFNIMSSTSSANGQNGVGLRLDNVNSGQDLQFKALAPNGGTGTGFVPVAGGYGATYFIVGRLTLDTTLGSVNRIWVNPASTNIPQDTDANSVAISFNATDSLTLRPSLAGRMFGTGAGSALFEDEVRIGGLPEDVMVVPEPSTFALIGLSGLALILRKRK